MPPTRIKVTVDDLWYELSADALGELQDYLREAPQVAIACGNLPPDHGKLLHAWIINRMERNDPGVALIPEPRRG